MLDKGLANRICAEEAQRVFNYDSQTGVFRWAIRPSNAVRRGDIAGGCDNSGYWRIGFQGTRYYGHHLAWLMTYKSWPEMDVDHINGFTWDNRIANLRLATSSQNLANSRIKKHNKSGFKGVHWRNDRQKYQACIKVNFQSQHLGYYDTAEEAHAAYVTAAKNVFGKFYNDGARL